MEENTQINTPRQEAGTLTPLKIGVHFSSTRNYQDNPERARAAITLNDCFVIKGVRVMKGENGLFVSMPARKGPDGQYREICHPITAEFARALNSTVLEEYQGQLARQMEESHAARHITDPEEAQQQAGAEPEMEPPAQSMGMEM